MNSKPIVKIELTQEQQAQIQEVTGNKVATLNLKIEELERRLAPGRHYN